MAYFSYYGNNTIMEIANVNGGDYNNNAMLLLGILLSLMNGDRGDATRGRTGVPHCSCGGYVPKLICDALGTWRCMMGCHD